MNSYRYAEPPSALVQNVSSLFSQWIDMAETEHTKASQRESPVVYTHSTMSAQQKIDEWFDYVDLQLEDHWEELQDKCKDAA